MVLTSRFPFADLEQFDGGSARMLDVPPFTPPEGASVLAQAGGDWLSETERLELVHAVDGHALAVSVLAGALTDRPPEQDLQALRAELLAAGRTDIRVGKVLRFYAELLSDADRMLVAIVGLFQRPVPASTVLTLGAHALVSARLEGWTPARVEAAVRQRLSGLLSWHFGGLLSAHPLVRDAFRPLVLSADTAQLATDTTLGDLPSGEVTTREEALRVVEMIELLLDAEHWHPADRLYQDRLGGQILMHLPAVQVGQRAAAAFVGTPARRHACRDQLTPRRFSFYLNAVGLLGLLAGAPQAAAPALHAAATEARNQGDTRSLSIDLQNLTELAGFLGDTEEGIRTGTHALEAATTAHDREEITCSHAYLGWVQDLAGATTTAEQHYHAADLIEHTDHPDGHHLYSLPGTWWAELLARTGRIPVARRLTTRNRQLCTRHRWHADEARCDRELGRCDLAEGDLDAATARLRAAMQVLRDGEHLVEWAATLPDLAECHRRSGQLDEARRLCTEAVTTAAPRGLVPTHARALATRALIRGDQFAATGNREHLDRARDDAHAAQRLATRTRRLPWHELDALRAHAYLDHLTGQDQGWQAKADKLHAELVPPGLDPAPLATVQAQVPGSFRKRLRRWLQR